MIPHPVITWQSGARPPLTVAPNPAVATVTAPWVLVVTTTSGDVVVIFGGGDALVVVASVPPYLWRIGGSYLLTPSVVYERIGRFIREKN